MATSRMDGLHKGFIAYGHYGNITVRRCRVGPHHNKIAIMNAPSEHAVAAHLYEECTGTIQTEFLNEIDVFFSSRIWHARRTSPNAAAVLRSAARRFD